MSILIIHYAQAVNETIITIMKFKIDTKEKFTVITPNEESLDANIAGELSITAISVLQKPPRNVILKLSNVVSIEDEAAKLLAQLQQDFYENNASFVICEIKPALEKKLEDLELLELMNITPTESEAWDIVQMEEIERELLDGDDV
ncbi:MAG: STAS domain-containing protein [Ilyomonas sp.]